MGNLRSVQKAFERVGHAAAITDDREVLEKADHVVLPGVGAFADAMAELERRDLVVAIQGAIASGKPFLGICLGLQLLFERSYEDGEHQGLGILPGEVRRFEATGGQKVPHMGWNQVAYRNQPPIFADVPEERDLYFVHSYYVVPDDPSVVAGETDYPDPFCSMIWRDHLFALQFHPEKSQQAGLRVLKSFAEYRTASD